MKSLNRAIDRFCYRHPGFGILNLMLFIIIGNAVVFIFMMMDTSGFLLYFLSFSPQLILRGQVWRIISFIFVPSTTNLLFLALSLYFYYFIGNTLERQWGKGRFTIFYFSGVLLTVIYGMISGIAFGNPFPVNVHYINLSLFFAFATLFPDTRILLFFIIPVKIKWLALLNAGYFLVDVVVNLAAGRYVAAFLPLVAILNYVIFCGEAFAPFIGGLRYRTSPETINFKRAARQIKKQRASGEGPIPRQRRCAVCGKTDSEFPEMEFRYCSRCAGYHCFCSDHINSHIHFSE